MLSEYDSHSLLQINLSDTSGKMCISEVKPATGKPGCKAVDNLKKMLEGRLLDTLDAKEILSAARGKDKETFRIFGAAASQITEYQTMFAKK